MSRPDYNCTLYLREKVSGSNESDRILNLWKIAVMLSQSENKQCTDA